MGVPSLLGQQELLAVPPARRLIVPVGHSAWWGVDPSTLRVAVAYVDAEGRRAASTASFASLEGPARLSEIYRQTGLFVRRLAGEWPAPGVVVVEQPSGKQENPALSYAVGVIQAAMYDGLYDAFGSAVKLETVTSSHWKKVACGRGDIFKPKSRSGSYGVLAWARLNGYAGFSWDEADALGVAECARREIGLEER